MLNASVRFVLCCALVMFLLVLCLRSHRYTYVVENAIFFLSLFACIHSQSAQLKLPALVSFTSKIERISAENWQQTFHRK